MTIIGLVSVLAIPAIVTGIQDRKMVGSVQALQGALVEAAGFAASQHATCGIRLVPSTTIPGMFDQVLSLVTPPRYSEGLVSIYPGADYSSLTSLPCLVVEQHPGTWTQAGTSWIFPPNSPTSWFFNVRLGDRISWGGKPYTVCGPMAVANNDLAVNGPPWQRTYTAPDGKTQVTTTVDYLFLVNGIDDNGDGYVDNGFDGIDNNANGVIDDSAEWEQELWTGPRVENVPYKIIRRPAPGNPQSAISLSIGVSLSASTLTVNPLSGNVDVMINPNGTVDLGGPYAAPSAVSMAQHQTVFAFVDPDGNQTNLTLTKTGLISTDVIK